jgi:hypothetical protein
MGIGRHAGASVTARFRLASRRRPRCDRAGAVDRQRRIPARARGLRAPRPLSPLDHHRRRRPAGDLQHRSDALHARHRRTGVHGLHAHAAVLHGVGVVLCDAVPAANGVARVRRHGGRRHFLPWRAAASRSCRRGDDLLHRRRHFPGVRGGALVRATDRADARVVELGPRRLDPRRIFRARPRLRPGDDVGCGSGGAYGLRRGKRRVQPASGRRRLLPARCAGGVLGRRISRCRTGRATAATAWPSVPAIFRPP